MADPVYWFHQGDEIALNFTADVTLTGGTVVFALERNRIQSLQKSGTGVSGTAFTVTLLEADTIDIPPGEYEAQARFTDSLGAKKTVALTDSDGNIVPTVTIYRRVTFV